MVDPYEEVHHMLLFEYNFQSFDCPILIVLMCLNNHCSLLNWLSFGHTAEMIQHPYFVLLDQLD